MQMKTTLGFDVTPTRMAKINTTQLTTNGGEDTEKEEHLFTATEKMNYAAIMETSIVVPQKTRNRTTNVTHTPRHISKGFYIPQQRYLHPCLSLLYSL